MATVGAVWINVLPSMQGFASNLQKQATSAAKVAAVGAGTQMGAAMGDATVGALAKKMTANSKRMQNTFAGSTNLMTRSLSNFRAGLTDADAAASRLTGRMGSLGGRTARGLQPGVRAVSGLLSGLADADAAASAFTGRAGAVGGAIRRGVQPAITTTQNLAAGFTSSQAAASALTGMAGSLGGTVRRGLQPAILAGQNLIAGFLDSRAAASAFTGTLGEAGGRMRVLFDAGVSGVRAFGSGVGQVASLVPKTFSAVGNAVSSVATAGGAAASQLGKSFTDAASTAARSIRNVLGGAIGHVGALLGAIGLGAFTSSVYQTATAVNEARASLAGMYGDAAQASDMVSQINTEFARSSVGVETLNSLAANLAYLGLEGEGALEVIRNIDTAAGALPGNAAAAVDSVTNALLTAQVQGNAFTGELNQISRIGFPIFDALAEHIGVTSGEIKDMASQGEISFEDLMAVMNDPGLSHFWEMTEASAEGVSKTFSQTLSGIGSMVRVRFAEMAESGLNRLAPGLQDIGDAIESGLDKLPQVLGRVREAFSELVDRTGIDRLGNILMGHVVPAVRDLWVTIQPLAAIIGGALVIGVRLLMDGLSRLAPVLSSVAGWLAENRKWVTLVGVAIMGGVAAYYALGVASAVIRTITSVTKIWTIAQAAFNAVMAMNPIMLVVVAIGALVAGLVYAYRNFEGFRNVVDTVWQAIKTAAMWIWERGLKPAFEGVQNGLAWISGALSTAGGWFTSLGEAAMGLWSDYIQPAFEWIWGLIKNIITAIITVSLIPLVLWFKIVSTIVMWLWENAFKPVFTWIGDLAVWLWENALKPAWDGIVAGVKWLGGWFQRLWTSYVKPALDWVGEGFQWLWGHIKNIFNWIVAHIQRWWTLTKYRFELVIAFIRGAFANAFNWFKDRVIKPVWDWISGHINRIWENGIKPAFEKMMEGVDWLKDAFESGKEFISDAWEGIRDSAKKPVNFLIDTVYNDGIRPLWNKVAGIVGGDQLDKVSTFATGGPVHGAGTATSDSIPALLSNNEHVWTAREVSAAGGHGAVEAIRAAALEGGSTYRAGGQVRFPGAPRIPSPSRLLAAVQDFLSPSGVFGAIGDVISGDYEGAVDRVLKPARDLTSEIGTEGLPGTPYLIVKNGGDKLKEKISELVSSWNSAMEGGGGGSSAWVGLASASARLQNAAAFADRQHGKPYQWGGVGNPSFDCSGFTGSIERVIRGVNPRARQHTTHSFQGTPPAGWVKNLRSPYMVGVRHGGRGGGHMAGTLLGKNVESGGRGVVTGPRAQGAGNFPHKFGFRPVVGEVGGGGGGSSVNTLYDRGGYIQPGTTLVSNRTGRPEPVLTSAQWRDMHALAQSVGANEGGELMRDAHIHLENSEATVQEAFRRLDTELRKRRRGGVHAGRTGR